MEQKTNKIFRGANGYIKYLPFLWLEFSWFCSLIRISLYLLRRGDHDMADAIRYTLYAIISVAELREELLKENIRIEKFKLKKPQIDFA